MKDLDALHIRPLQPADIKDINKTNEPFTIFGKLVPSFIDGIWTYKEQLFETSHNIQFPDDHLNWDAYINSDQKIVYLAYNDKACVGQIRIVKDWNKYGYIENIAVCKAYRKSGIGEKLFKKAEEWAKTHNLLGLSLEAQDDNLAACRFYIKQGMTLGGVDTMKHHFNPHIEKALYWYKPF